MAEQPRATPFSTAEEAWFWTACALQARSGSRCVWAKKTTVKVAPCDPDDVLRALDMLYRRSTIGPAHARALGRWGVRQEAPPADHPTEDVHLWNEAMAALATVLRAKGIVA